jgi:EAL domain-containing protein (putative c-di-GMP-specific phosphodiesterase class I)/CHASE2 domain-containing sensor protein/GGDEF domain-containing protein
LPRRVARSSPSVSGSRVALFASRAGVWLRPVATFAMAAGLLAAFSFSQVAARLDYDLAALRMETAKRLPSNTLTIVEIDAASLEAAGHWPWGRERYAQVLDNLTAAGAGLVAFDIDFSARSTPEGDAEFKRVIDANAGWVVLPTFLQPDLQHQNVPLAGLAANAVVASVNIELSEDGRVRTYRRGFHFAETLTPTFAGFLSGSDLGDAAPFYIDFGIAPEKLSRISFDDVLNNRFDPDLVRDRTILIGATAVELGDHVSTPHMPAIPGVYIHALAYETLFQGRAITQLSIIWSLIVGMLLLLAGICMAACLKLPQVFALQMLAAVVTWLSSAVLHEAASVSLALSPIVGAIGLSLVYAIRHKVLRDERALIDQRAAHLEFMARHDSETGLPNRIALLEAMRTSHPDKGSGVIILISAGIEKFAELRGSIGYANAVEVIGIATAGLARAGIGQDFYRLDSALVATVVRVDDQQAAEKFVSQLTRHTFLTDKVGDQAINLHFRMGVVISAAGELTPETMLERAALSVDHARKHKRDIVCWGDADFEDPHLKFAMLNDILTGIDRGEFTLLYQPKYSIQTNSFSDAEALIRWKHHKLGNIPPWKFISVAEETGAIDALTLWVADQAIRDQACLREQGITANFAINLSAGSLSDVNLCRELITRIRRAGAAMTVEITETAMIGRPEQAALSLKAFQEAGIRIAIDDYGSGHSSLAYLKSLNADELKIDRSLILDVTSSRRDRLILKSTFDLARALGMKVICEGVEDELTFAALAALGCDMIQGYFVGRPMGLAELAEKMTGPGQPLIAPADDLRARNRLAAG